MYEAEKADLHKDRSLLSAVLDVYDCRRVLRSMDEPHSWLDAFQLHRTRVWAHRWLHQQGYRD